jgi:hypothetical protein
VTSKYLALSEENQLLLKRYPFVSCISYGGRGYIGIVQNLDDVLTSFYDFGSLRTTDQRTEFLKLGETWWWESNRKIPINLFLKTDWEKFRFSLRVFNSRDARLEYGPSVNLRDLVQKRYKRRSVTLIRKVP